MGYIWGKCLENGVVCGGVWCEVPGVSAASLKNLLKRHLRGTVSGAQIYFYLTFYRYFFSFYHIGKHYALVEWINVKKND